MLKTEKIGRFFTRNHKGVIQKMSRMNRFLSDLRYEGKSCYGRNLKKAEILFETLREELSQDMEFEEEALFPYLRVHLPKLEFMIHVLQEEHEALERRLGNFGSLLQALSKKENGAARIRLIDKMRKKGNYLNYFLHQHTWAEQESVYRAVDMELSGNEKGELGRRLAEFRVNV